MQQFDKNKTYIFKSPQRHIHDMSWLFYALATPILEAGKDLTAKYSLKHIDEYVITWCAVTIASIILLPLALYQGIPTLDATFWKIIAVDGVIVSLANVLYMRAIKNSDVSLSVPFISFTPVFLLLLSPIILNESPGVYGILGVLLIVAGAYTLQISKKEEGILAPFYALFRNTGPRTILFVAFLWSITSTFDKIGIQHSTPITWAAGINIMMMILLTPFILKKSVGTIVRTHYLHILPIGIFMGARMITQMMAVQTGILTYVISLKRTSTLLVIIGGTLIFKEQGIKERLPGAILMILGVLLITIGN